MTCCDRLINVISISMTIGLGDSKTGKKILTQYLNTPRDQCSVCRDATPLVEEGMKYMNPHEHVQLSSKPLGEAVMMLLGGER